MKKTRQLITLTLAVLSIVAANNRLIAQSGISVNGTSSTITSTTGSIGFGSNNLSTTGSLNLGGASADASALVNIGSTTQGILIPRMSTTQRLAISSPGAGLQVYDNTLNALFYYNGTSWNQVTCSSSSITLTAGRVPVITSGNSLINSPLTVSSNMVGVATSSPDASLNIYSGSTGNQFTVSATIDGSVQDVFAVDNTGNTTIAGNTGAGATPSSLTPMNVQSTTSHYAAVIATVPTGTSTAYGVMANVDFLNNPSIKALAVHNTYYTNPGTPFDAFYVTGNGNGFYAGQVGVGNSNMDAALTISNSATTNQFSIAPTLTDGDLGTDVFNIDGSGNTMMAGKLNVVGNQVTMSGIVADTVGDTIPGNLLQMDKMGHVQPLALAKMQEMIFPALPFSAPCSSMTYALNNWARSKTGVGFDGQYTLTTKTCQLVGIGDQSPDAQLSIGSTSNKAFTVTNGTSDFFSVDGAGNTSTSGTFSIYNTTLTSNVFTIDNSGNTYTNGTVGINTTRVPSGYSLAVNGSIIATDVYVELYSAWPDYVFNKEYKLMSLSQLDKYISDNHHLPGVPSSQEVKDKGAVDVSTMIVKQQEKLEEVSLYLIQLEKEIQDLKAENEKLKADKTKQ